MKSIGTFLVALALVLALDISARSGPAPIKITLWHSQGGAVGRDNFPELARRFRAVRPDVEVEITFQGAYDEALTKLLLGVRTKQVPTIANVYEIGMRRMIDTGGFVPIQEFIDAERFNIYDFESSLVRYFRIGGKLHTMPFNNTTPVIFYNKDLFRRAGLDPERPPTTFEGWREAARRITQKDATGRTTVFGFGNYYFGWYFEQLLAKQNALFANNGNGRQKLATEAVFNSPEGVRILQWLADMHSDGSYFNAGRSGGDLRRELIAGRLGFRIGSAGGLAFTIREIAGRWELGTAPLPIPQGSKSGGTPIGGASLWIMKDRPAEEQKAAWDFIKFITAPEQQAYWHMNVGDYAVTPAAYSIPEVVMFHSHYPQYLTAVKQLRESAITNAASGAVLGVFPEARKEIEEAMEAVLLGRATPKQTLDKAAAEVTKAIGRYNRSMGLVK